MRIAWGCLLMWLAAGSSSCAQHAREPVATSADSSRAVAIARDRPQRLVLPLAGAMTLERVALEREALDRQPPARSIAVSAPTRLDPALPDAEPGAPPEPAAPAPPVTRSLRPPIPRGTPGPVSGGSGGRVTLDVRVDERGEVSELHLVQANADSLAVRAAEEAAQAMRYHPALLGAEPVAVWTRQAFDVRPGGRGGRR